MNKQRYLLVVSGPSGAGKDTVVSRMMQKHPEIEISVSATTRAPRAGETDGENYYFLTNEQFEAKIDRGEMLEYVNYCGKYYGTPKSEVDARLDRGTTVVLVIEVVGAANIKKLYPESTLIFIMPPSMDELRARLRGRGTESEEAIAGRLKRAEEELPYARKIVELRDAVEEVESCSACYGYLIPALDRLREEGKFSMLREKICIGQGYRGKTGELGIGNCTRKFRHSLEGCPPTENQIYDFLKEFLER